MRALALVLGVTLTTACAASHRISERDLMVGPPPSLGGITLGAIFDPKWVELPGFHLSAEWTSFASATKRRLDDRGSAGFEAGMVRVELWLTGTHIEDRYSPDALRAQTQGSRVEAITLVDRNNDGSDSTFAFLVRRVHAIGWVGQIDDNWRVARTDSPGVFYVQKRLDAGDSIIWTTKAVLLAAPDYEAQMKACSANGGYGIKIGIIASTSYDLGPGCLVAFRPDGQITPDDELLAARRRDAQYADQQANAGPPVAAPLSVVQMQRLIVLEQQADTIVRQVNNQMVTGQISADYIRDRKALVPAAISHGNYGEAEIYLQMGIQTWNEWQTLVRAQAAFDTYAKWKASH